MLTCHVETVPSGSKPRLILQVSSPLSICLPLSCALLAEAACEWGPGVETMFSSQTRFPEPLEGTCEERSTDVEELQTPTAIGHLHRSSAGPALAWVGGLEFLSLSEGVRSRPYPGPSSLLLGSEERPCLLMLEASKATGRCYRGGCWSLPRLREQAAGTGRSGFSFRFSTCSM